MPALPVRRTLVTGMRSFPFRDWKRTEGLPAVPGYSPVWDWQPVMTESDAAARRQDRLRNRQPDARGAALPRRAAARRALRRPPGASGIEGEIAAIERAVGRRPSAPSRRASRRCASWTGSDPFFLAIDPFDPVDATEAPPIYVKPGEVEKEGIGPMNDRMVELKFGGGDSTSCAMPTASTSRAWTAGSDG